MPPKFTKVRSGIKLRVKKVNNLPLTPTISDVDETSSISSTGTKSYDGNNNEPVELEKAVTLLERSENNFVSAENMKVDNQKVILVGDIVWSKIPGHCWWPSMVSYDPVDAVFCTQVNGRAKKFHVQFFGDKSLRGWVFKSNLIKFEGREAFLSLQSKIPSKSKLPKSSQRESWENAVKQAEKAILLNRNERKLKYVFNYDRNVEQNTKKDSIPLQKPLKKDMKTSTSQVVKESEGIRVDDSSAQHQAENRPIEMETNSDSGIEDLGENVQDDEKNNPETLGQTMKRKRKQKVFSDYHTGEEITLAIKSTSWKPLPPIDPNKNTRQSRSRRKSPKQVELQPELLPSNAREENKKSDSEQIDTKEFTIIKLPFKEKNTKVALKRKRSAPSSHLLSEDSPIKNGKQSKKVIGEKPAKKVKIEKKHDDLGDAASDSSDTKNKLKQDTFCSLCEEVSKELVFCSGSCSRAFHMDCLGLSCMPAGTFTCDECQTGHHICFLCKKTGNVTKCSQANCGKFYHNECMDELQSNKSDDKKHSVSRSFCTHHSCKLCTNSTKDKNGSSNIAPNNSRRLIRCIRCPTAYHNKTCLIAGSVLLSPNHMICEQHFEVGKSKKSYTHVNVTWCFVCSNGGSLVCCDTCPASFHPECTDDLTGIPEGAWKCRDCLQHIKPKYGDIVWVKFGVYRWWPAKICFPDDIPEKIHGLSHSHGEFPVMFFGSHDYAWLHSGRVFKYEEGDKGGRLCKSNSLGMHFTKALEEAKAAFEEQKKEAEQLSETLDRKKSKKPPPYKSIKVNRPVSCVRTILDPSEWPVCECTVQSPCSGESECLNRMLYFECTAKTCRAGEKCQNQRMQKCQYMKVKPFKCGGRGWGLQSEQCIKSGEFVIEYVGELIDELTCQARVKQYHEEGISDYYFLTIDRDNIIDAYPKGNLSRFMNHSCDPNCETQKWTVNGEVRVGLFATRDIAIGEELCFNYHLDSLGNEKKQCKCGSANCSGYLGVKPKTQHAMSLAEKAQLKKLKEKERRKLKMQKKKQQAIVHEDECFLCNDGGNLILCGRLKCTKSYHLKCLKLEKNPHGRWQCPWHFCDSCGKPAKVLCVLCPNSYCKSHEEGEMFTVRDGVFLCSDHSEDELNKLLAELKNKDEEQQIVQEVLSQQDTETQQQRESNTSLTATHRQQLEHQAVFKKPLAGDDKKNPDATSKDSKLNNQNKGKQRPMNSGQKEVTKDEKEQIKRVGKKKMETTNTFSNEKIVELTKSARGSEKGVKKEVKGSKEKPEQKRTTSKVKNPTNKKAKEKPVKSLKVTLKIKK